MKLNKRWVQRSLFTVSYEVGDAIQYQVKPDEGPQMALVTQRVSDMHDGLPGWIGIPMESLRSKPAPDADATAMGLDADVLKVARAAKRPPLIVAA